GPPYSAGRVSMWRTRLIPRFTRDRIIPNSSDAAILSPYRSPSGTGYSPAARDRPRTMDGVRMRTYVWTALFAVACGGDNGFSTDDNDPGNEEGTGVAEFFPTELLFEDCEPDISYSEPFKITNVGDNTLSVYEISVIAGGSVFYVENVEEFGLEPKEHREFSVVATLTAPMEPADGTLR